MTRMTNPQAKETPSGSKRLPPPPGLCEFLETTSWRGAACEPIAGDASTRRYFRLRKGGETAILMDASQNRESIAPFVAIARHLQHLGFSAPAILEGPAEQGLLLVEDFGDATFTRLLEDPAEQERLYALATDVLIALHQKSEAVPKGLREYHPQRMLDDIELLLEWRTPGISEEGKKEFRQVWVEVLPRAHQVPRSLLLRDYHVANLMILEHRQGLRRVGLLDFQDAYQGPVTYDLVSLLQDARRDVPEELRAKMTARYLAAFPALDAEAFETSAAILAALRHTRVLAIFERLSRFEGKHDYKQRHSPRVEALLNKAMNHPDLSGVRQWIDRYAQ
jgi:N-acetylmuramate 1-kinase